MDEQQIDNDLEELFDAQDAKELEQQEENTPASPPEPAPEEPAEEPTKEPEAPKEPEQPAETPKEEPPKHLTLDDIKTVINDVRSSERDSYKSVESLKEEILTAYLPEGLPKVVTDEEGREYHTPQDVIKAVEAKGGEISFEEAHQWLLNEDYKLQKSRQDYIDNAQQLAEVNANFRNGGIRVLEQYASLFEKMPAVQQKVYKNYMKAVKWDEDKGIILSAPDIEEYYADYLEPYLAAHADELSKDPTPPPAPEPKPKEAKPSIEDRMDETGDGGTGKVVDKNNPEDSLDDLFGNG